MSPLTFKINNLYVAYAPDSGAYSFGDCFEEAVNGLTDLLALPISSKPASTEGSSSVVG